MLKYLTKRILRSFLTLAIIITVVFVLMRQMPIAHGGTDSGGP